VKTEKYLGKLGGEIGAIMKVLTPSLKKIPITSNEPFGQEMQLKIPRSSVCLILSDPKLACREADLHLVVEQIPPIDSWHPVDSERCNFRLLMPALALVSLLEG
jgi:hypothetical protein